MAFTVRTLPEYRLRIITTAETVDEVPDESLCPEYRIADYDPA